MTVLPARVVCWEAWAAAKDCWAVAMAWLSLSAVPALALVALVRLFWAAVTAC